MSIANGVSWQEVIEPVTGTKKLTEANMASCWFLRTLAGGFNYFLCFKWVPLKPPSRQTSTSCLRKLGSMVSKWVISPTYKWLVFFAEISPADGITFDPNFQRYIQVHKASIFVEAFRGSFARFFSMKTTKITRVLSPQICKVEKGGRNRQS